MLFRSAAAWYENSEARRHPGGRPGTEWYQPAREGSELPGALYPAHVVPPAAVAPL